MIDKLIDTKHMLFGAGSSFPTTFLLADPGGSFWTLVFALVNSLIVGLSVKGMELLYRELKERQKNKKDDE